MRVVQLSDLHLRDGLGEIARSAADGARRWVIAEPPDLVVLTGDLVYEDPDNADDRRTAIAFARSLGCRVEVIPGNHDVGFFDPEPLRSARIARFRDAWGSDRFVVDADGWRLIGVDSYTVGDPEADGWLADALETPAAVALFLHHPVAGDVVDGWEAPPAVARRLAELTSGRDVRLVGTGHRHCAVTRSGTDLAAGDALAGAIHVWAPSLTITGSERYHGGDPRPGAVEYRFGPDGRFEHQFVYPPAP